MPSLVSRDRAARRAAGTVAVVLAPLVLQGCFSTPEATPQTLVAAPSAPIQRADLAPPTRPAAPLPAAPGAAAPPAASPPGQPIDPVTGRPIDPLDGSAADAAPAPPVANEPLPPEPGPTQVATAAPAAPKAPVNVGRTDLLGRWTISSGGEKCDIYMSLTTWTGGYRASTRGCNSPTLAGISAWDLSGRTVTLKGGDGAASVASVSANDQQSFSGSTADGAGITFSR